MCQYKPDLNGEMGVRVARKHAIVSSTSVSVGKSIATRTMGLDTGVPHQGVIMTYTAAPEPPKNPSKEK